MNELLKCENGPQIRPELRHVAEEVDTAIRSGDTEAVKAIFIREGVPWIDVIEIPERYRNRPFGAGLK